MDPLIKPDMSHFKTVTANLTVGGETCNLASTGRLSAQPEAETELAPFMRKGRSRVNFRNRQADGRTSRFEKPFAIGKEAN